MKINREKLEKLASLDDSALWAQIRTLAGTKGINLPDVTPSHAELERIRGAMRGTEKINLSDAAKILNSYKRNGGN